MKKLLLSMITLLSCTMITPSDKVKGPNTYSSRPCEQKLKKF